MPVSPEEIKASRDKLYRQHLESIGMPLSYYCPVCESIAKTQSQVYECIGNKGTHIFVNDVKTCSCDCGYSWLPIEEEEKIHQAMGDHDE